MAFADYLELRLAVGERVGRRDLSEVMPQFTKLAETRLSRVLRLLDQITEATVTMADGVGTLPTDFVEAIEVKDGSRVYTQASVTTPAHGSTGTYGVIGQEIRMYGYTGDLTVTYYASIPTITTSPTATNWLLQKGPDVYLYAVSREAADHIRDGEAAQYFESRTDKAIIELHSGETATRWGNARIRQRGPTP